MSEKRNFICIGLVVAAACGWCWFKGTSYLVKYWLVPFLYMHLSVGSFKTKSTERYSYLALFPDVKQWAEMEKGMLEAVQKACEYIPIYNVKLMHSYLEEQIDIKSIKPSAKLSNIMTRMMLLRGKRDAILAVAALVSMIAFKSAGAVGLGVLCLSYCVYSLVVEAKKRQWIENLNAPQAIYVTGVHFLALWGLAAVTQCHWSTLMFALCLWPISGLGITAGAHRLWAHRSYEAALPFRVFLLLCNGMANQGTIYHWSRDHRVHHMGSETDSDPHNAMRGFFFSHMGWLYLKKHPEVVEAGAKLNYSDLLADPVVRFQIKFNPLFNMFMCFGFPALVPWLFWGESLLNGFLVAGALRYVWVLHGTWCVNSVAHLYGERPYDPKISPSESLMVSLWAIGEGWHNWHHAYPYDYAASELGVSSQFNPTKLLLDMAAAVGLVWKRKRATAVWKATQERRVREHLRKLEESKEAAAKAAEEAEEDDPDDFTALGDKKETSSLRERKNAVKSVEGEQTEAKKKTAQEKVKELTVRELRHAIPARLFKRSAWISMMHFAYDVCLALATAAAVIYAWRNLGGWWMAIIWPIYWWYQGLNGTALWVLAHECGHGAFSDSKLLNDSVGFIIHSALLTPYFSWALTHAKHHRRTNNMSEGETWVPAATRNPDKPKIKFLKSHLGTCIRITIILTIGWYLYLFRNDTGSAKNRGQSHFNPNSKGLFRPADRPFVLLSDVGMIITLICLAAAVLKFGLLPVLLVYAIPQMITDMYLVSITFMQHTHMDLPHMDFPVWNWLNGALCTVDRSMGPWVDSKLHHIVDSHVVHHLFHEMPFYGAKEATPYIAKYLTDKFGEGVYNSKNSSYLEFWKDFYWATKEALVVVREPDAEIYHYK
eukprot:GGOE01026608.1.p1 GENE.GGOE01026608.1~~GGOE01026608.1.p1  ORF type:complete len:1020 (+),score=210.66 GGOE01026608.1:409-3060(+)